MMKEKYGTRDLTYNEWHRTNLPGSFGMIDIDVVEFDRDNSQPLALMETAIDVGDEDKVAKVTANLSRICTLPAYVLLYRHAKTLNPKSELGVPDIDQFKVRRLYPDPESVFRTYSPEEWKEELGKIRKTGFPCLQRRLTDLR